MLWIPDYEEAVALVTNLRIYSVFPPSMRPRRLSPFLMKAILRVIAHSIRHNLASSGTFHGPRNTEEGILKVTGPGHVYRCSAECAVGVTDA